MLTLLTISASGLVSVALFLALYLGLALAAFGGRPLTVTPLYGVRTFLPPGITRWPAAVWLASGGIVTASARPISEFRYLVSPLEKPGAAPGRRMTRTLSP